jgi:hypothetical protein
MRKQVENTELTGIDSAFHMNYMGAAEFEWGALPKALGEMKDQREKMKHVVELITPDNKYRVWFVGRAKDVENATEFFIDQMEERKWNLKERTYIAPSLDEADPCHWFYKELIGWWALDTEVPFALFTTREYADTWLRLLGER